jgi:hypothetical protein
VRFRAETFGERRRFESGSRQKGNGRYPMRIALDDLNAAGTLSDEEGRPARAAGLRELQAPTVQYLEQRLRT